MTKGFIVIQEQGNPVYCFMQDKVSENQELMVSGFVTAMQLFAKTVIAAEGEGVRSVSLSRTVYTFRTLTLHNEKHEDMKYYFAVLTDAEKKNEYLAETLEYLIVSFLGYESGRFDKALRESAQEPGAFKTFDEFVGGILKSDWSAIRKKVKPVPASLFQGILNGLRDYIPVEQIVTLNPKIQRIGPSYAWLSDDLPENEQKDLLNRIKQIMTRMYGKGVYESIAADVLKQLSAKVSPRP